MSHARAMRSDALRFVSEQQLVDEVLVRCPRCGVSGPRARLPRHLAVDHRGEPRLPKQFIVGIPPRFRRILESLQDRAGRPPFSELIEEALEEWLRGRARNGFRRSTFNSGWGETAKEAQG